MVNEKKSSHAFDGKVAYVTGGSRGIGKAIVQALLSEGLKVGFSARTSESLEKAKAFFYGEKNRLLGLVSDVRNSQQELDTVSSLVSEWGRLDVVVANAGIGHFGPVQDFEKKYWDEIIDTNVKGVFNTVKASIPFLKKSRGYIFTISSLSGTNFFPGGSAYIASKFALTGFSQAIMQDLRNQGIKVTTIMPGSVATHFNNRKVTEAENWKIQPEDLANLIVTLLKMPVRTLPSKIEVRPLEARK